MLFKGIHCEIMEERFLKNGYLKKINLNFLA